MFRTILKLSNGVATTTSEKGLAYSEMINTNGYQDRLNNFNKGNKVLPGVSEEQDVSYRPSHPWPTENAVKRDNAPFVQPGQKVETIKDDDSE